MITNQILVIVVFTIKLKKKILKNSEHVKIETDVFLTTLIKKTNL